MAEVFTEKMERICTITFKIRAKIEVKQHLYRFHFKLGALPHPDGLLVSGSVLHLTSVVFMALILGEFAYMYKLAIFCNLVTIVLNNMLCYMYLRIKYMKDNEGKKKNQKKERKKQETWDMRGYLWLVSYLGPKSIQEGSQTWICKVCKDAYF